MVLAVDGHLGRKGQALVLVVDKAVVESGFEILVFTKLGEVNFGPIFVAVPPSVVEVGVVHRIVLGERLGRGLVPWHPTVAVGPDGRDHSDRAGRVFGAVRGSLRITDFHHDLKAAGGKKGFADDHPSDPLGLTVESYDRALVLIAMASANENMLLFSINDVLAEKNIGMHGAMVALSPLLLQPVPSVGIDLSARPVFFEYQLGGCGHENPVRLMLRGSVCPSQTENGANKN